MAFSTTGVGDVRLYYIAVFGAYRTALRNSSVTGGTLTVTPAAVPEPASAALLVAGVAGLAALRRRRATPTG